MFITRILSIFVGLFLSISVIAQTTSAPDLGIRPNLASGEVKAIDTAGNKISLMTKDGPIDAMLSTSTVYKRVPPENPSLSAATPSSLSEIGVGDKVLITGLVSEDKKTMPAKQVILMTKSDIAKKQQKEKDEWRTRGVSGRVVSVNIPSLELVLATRVGATETNVKLSPKENASFMRYSTESIKYEDAKPSSFAEIKVGDQVRAIGDKSADGISFKAERILSGAFKTMGGTVTAINAEKNEITIKEFASNKPLIINLKKDALLKKIPAEMAAMMAMAQRGSPGGATPGGGNVVTMRPPGATAPPASGQPSAGQNPAGGKPTPGAGMVAGRGEFDDMVARFPAITLADIKVGDVIAVSCANGPVPNQVTAFKLLSGVEPFIQVAQAMAAMGGGRGQSSPSLNIPGLDGFGAP